MQEFIKAVIRSAYTTSISRHRINPRSIEWCDEKVSTAPEDAEVEVRLMSGDLVYIAAGVLRALLGIQREETFHGR